MADNGKRLDAVSDKKKKTEILVEKEVWTLDGSGEESWLGVGFCFCFCFMLLLVVECRFAIAIAAPAAKPLAI